MKKSILFIILFCSCFCYGQNDTKAPADFKKFLIGINISPDYCNRILKNNGGGETGSMIIGIRNSNEIFKIGYSAGINFCYNFSGSFGVEIGAQYSSKGYSTRRTDLTFGDMIDPRFGFTYNTNGTAYSQNNLALKIFYDHNYFDIPLRAIFSFGENKLHFISSIGLTTNILINSRQTFILEDADGIEFRESTDQNENFKSINLSPSLSAGFDYKVGNKINLRAEPTIRYGLLKIIDTDITAHLWNCGLNISCYYSLK